MHVSGDQLEVTYTSPEICPASTSRTKNVMTIITFTCSSTDDVCCHLYQALADFFYDNFLSHSKE